MELRRMRQAPRISVSHNTQCFKILTFQTILDTLVTSKRRSLKDRLISVGAASGYSRGRFFESLLSDSAPQNGGYRVQRVKEALLMTDKKQPSEPRTERHPRCQIGRYAGETPAFCAEPGKVEVDGLLLCERHSLKAKLEGQIACWDEMLFHVDLWSREAGRRNRGHVGRLLKAHRGEVASAMDRALSDLERARSHMSHRSGGADDCMR